jgi:hypothetical protein
MNHGFVSLFLQAKGNREEPSHRGVQPEVSAKKKQQ